jgi:acyl carrier protein
MDRPTVIGIIIACTEDYRGTGPIAGGDRIGPSTRLFGPQGVLDSIGLVSVVVAVEQRIRDEHQIDVSLMDDRAVSQTHSPFRTPETLADYVLSLQAGPKG